MNTMKMGQCQEDLQKLIADSCRMLRILDEYDTSQQQQQLFGSSCNGCRQRDQIIKQLEETVRELRATLSSFNAGQQLASTYISERQQQAIDSKMLELMNDKQHSEEKYNAAMQELEAFKAQLKLYQDDFNAEREDRARARGELAKVEAERDQYIKQLKDCVRELSRYRAVQQNCSQQFYQAAAGTAYAFGPHEARGPRYLAVGIDETDAVATDANILPSASRRRTSPSGTPPHGRSANSSPVACFTDDSRPIVDSRNTLDSEKYDSFGAGVTTRRSGSPSYVGSSSPSGNAGSVCEIDLMSFTSLNNSRSSPTRSANR